MKNKLLNQFASFNNGNLGKGILSIVLVMACFVSLLYASGLTEVIIFMLISLIPAYFSYSYINDYLKEKRKLKNSDDQLCEVKEKFTLENSQSLDEDKIIQKAMEKNDEIVLYEKNHDEKINIAFVIALWHIFDGLNLFNVNEKINKTYNAIMEMKINGRSDDEIAEYLMMEMAERYGYKKRLLEIENSREDIRKRFK